MATFFLGSTTGSNSEAYQIDDNYFASVAVGNPGAVTIGSDEEVSYTEAVSYLGVTAIRWPGGTEAERSFDWKTENSDTHPLDVSDMKNAIDYCAQNNLNFNFTFPTSSFKGLTENEIIAMKDQIVAFFKDDLIAYAASKNVKIDAIKLGNEYDVNGLTASEYGVISSALAEIVGSTLVDCANLYEEWQKPDLVVEAGRIWFQEFGQTGQFFGDSDKNGILDAIEIMESFDSNEAQYVDAVDVHCMNLFLSTFDDYFGEGPYSDATMKTVYDSLDGFWDSTFSDVELQCLAWQYPWMRDIDGPSGSGGVVDHGGASLANAALGFMQFFEMSAAGITYATSWMATGWGSASPMLFDDTPRAGGELFRLMKENLVGLKAVEFAEDPTVFQNNTDTTDVVFRAFEKDGQVVLYIGNLEASAQTITLKQVYKFLSSLDGIEEVSNLLDSENLHFWASILGVEGDPYGYGSLPTLDILNFDDLAGSDPSWNIELKLDAHEIAQLVFTSHQGVKMIGYEDNDTLAGSLWDDNLSGLGGNDSLVGDGGDDTLNGGNGNDTLNGGDGHDIAVFDVGLQDVYIEEIEQGIVRITSAQGIDLVENVEEFSFADATLSYSELIEYSLNPIGVEKEGSSSADTIFGSGGNDVINGHEGADVIDGFSGNDLLIGGSGSDIIRGGTGDDEILGGWGTDTIDGGAGNDLLWGGQHNDDLFGSDGDDILFGEGGNDTLNGGDGQNTLTGGGGSDVFVFSSWSSKNVVTDFEPGKDTLDFSGLFEGLDLGSISLGDSVFLRTTCYASNASDIKKLNVLQIGDDVEIYVSSVGDATTVEALEPVVVLEDVDLATLEMNDFLLV